MDYDHPALKEIGLTDEKVIVTCKRMDDDLAKPVEEARRGDDPERLAYALMTAVAAMAVRLTRH